MTDQQIVELHPTEWITAPHGGEVAIDVDMVDTVRAVWALGLTTDMSCQDLGAAMAAGTWPVPLPERISTHWTGRAWLRMPRSDGQRLLSILHKTVQFRVRLAAKADGGWQSYVWLGPDGLADYVNVYFPNEQLSELAMVLAEIKRASQDA